MTSGLTAVHGKLAKALEDGFCSHSGLTILPQHKRPPAKSGASRYNRTRVLPMHKREIGFAVQEPPEGSYEARALGHSIYTPR